MTRKQIVLVVVGILAVIWAARVIEALAAQSRVPGLNEVLQSGAVAIWTLQIDKLDAEGRVMGALFPFVGGPIHRAVTGGERQRLIKSIASVKHVEEFLARSKARLD